MVKYIEVSSGTAGGILAAWKHPNFGRVSRRPGKLPKTPRPVSGQGARKSQAKDVGG